nr:hypothetical protein BgiMline_014069 [Biomphalaria glabrata]
MSTVLDSKRYKHPTQNPTLQHKKKSSKCTGQNGQGSRSKKDGNGKHIFRSKRTHKELGETCYQVMPEMRLRAFKITGNKKRNGKALVFPQSCSTPPPTPLPQTFPFSCASIQADKRNTNTV